MARNPHSGIHSIERSGWNSVSMGKTHYDPMFEGPYRELVPPATEKDEVCEIHIDRQSMRGIRIMR